MSNASLKQRLILVTLAAVLATWVLSAILLLSLYRRTLRDQLDRTLSAQAAALQAQVRFPKPHELDPPPRREGEEGRRRRERPPPPPLAFDPAAAMLLDRDAGGDAALYQIREHPGGRIIAASAALKDVAIDVVPPKAVPSRFDFVLPDGRPARAASIRFTVRTDGEPIHPYFEKDVIVTVIRSLAPIDRNIAQLAQILAVAGMVGTGLVILAVLLSIRFGLSPVGAVADQISAIGRNNLSQRVDAGRMPSELQPLAQHVNALLARLEEAFDRERSFIADAAHELRTPLAALHTATEIALRQDRTPADYQQVLARNMRVLAGMHALVEKLLLLARLENQSVALHAEDMPAAEIACSIWEDARLAVGRKDLVFHCDLNPTLTLRADPDLLCVVLTNLLRNAAQYTNEGGEVTVDGRTWADGWSLTVINTGCDLTDEQLLHLFDRFWQADRSRTRVGENAGLGLSIARRAAELMGCDLAADRAEGGRLSMTLRTRL